MAAEREALAAMLVVRANASQETACVVAPEKAEREETHVAEATSAAGGSCVGG
jgi:hypothetical protein